jgi:hypothetical protein
MNIYSSSRPFWYACDGSSVGKRVMKYIYLVGMHVIYVELMTNMHSFSLIDIIHDVRDHRPLFFRHRGKRFASSIN